VNLLVDIEILFEHLGSFVSFLIVPMMDLKSEVRHAAHSVIPDDGLCVVEMDLLNEVTWNQKNLYRVAILQFLTCLESLFCFHGKTILVSLEIPQSQ
jgi:hypothetical protein